MSTIPTTSSARIDFRLPFDFKRQIEKAAMLLGQTVTEYSVSRLVHAAVQDIKEHETTVLSDRDRDIFMEMLCADSEPNEAMKKAAARYKARRA